MLQGTLIPTLFGQGSFNGRPALVLSEIDGITLRQLAKANVHEKRSWRLNLRKLLRQYMSTKLSFGTNLGNFLFRSNRELNSPNTCGDWERSVNSGGVGYLMSRFRYMRNPGRSPSPIASGDTSKSTNLSDASRRRRA
ncbi:hypothetical protein N7453_000168 [Penicillium expansum]|nr:hypothetical protein N7453_000168 [Penicillium expansum]